MHTPAGFAPAARRARAAAGDCAGVRVYRRDELLVCGAEAMPTVPTLGEFGRKGIAGERHYLGRLRGVDCVAITLPGDASAPDGCPDGCRYAGLRSLFLRLPEDLLALAARAFQVVEWDRTHRFCGHCATPMVEREDERAKHCPACGQVDYPRISPAMMVLVTRGREVLLARANRFPGAMYSALAGFVEPGETIEDCVHREVREEVGIEVTGLRLLREPVLVVSAFADDRLHRRYADGEIAPDRAEIADARWFAPDALPELPSPLSIARRLIDQTVATLRRGSLPATLR